jgi:hypothetical protein
MKIDFKNLPLWATMLVVLVLGLVLFVLLSQGLTTEKKDDIGEKAIKYINETFFQGEASIELLGISQESGVHKLKIKIDGKEYDTYVSEDGKYLFPEGLDMREGEPGQGELNEEEITQLVVSQIIKNFLPEGTEIEVTGVSQESGVYKLKVKVDEETDVYATKDGKYLFLQVFDMDAPLEEIVAEPVLLPKNIESFLSCLGEKGFKVYGEKTCPHCKDLVEKLGGYDLVGSIYVECTEEREVCQEKTKTAGVPEIQINDEVYEGERTLESFALATGCELEY